MRVFITLPELPSKSQVLPELPAEHVIMVPLLLWLTIQTVYGLFDSSDHVKNTSPEEMRELVKDPDYMTVVMIYDNEGANSQAVAPILEQVAERYKHFFKFVGVDCTDDEKMCPPKVKESLPALTAYVPAGINPYTNKPLVYTRDYQGPVSPKDIGDFFIKNMHFLGEILDLDNEEWFFENKELKKVVLFTDKEHVPPLFKGLVSKYRGRLEFGVVFKNQTDILADFKVSAFPTILVVGEETEEYEGAIHFEDISEFLDSYAAKTKVEIRSKSRKREEEQRDKPKAPPKSDMPDFSPVKATGGTFRDLLDDNLKLTLVHFRQGAGLSEWSDIAKMFEGLVFTIDLNCENDDAALALARKEGVKRFPAMRLFPANRKRKSFEVTVDDDIEDEISKELKYDIVTVADANLNGFIKQMNEEDRVGCLYMSDKSAPLALKGLAADPHFKDIVTFGFYNKKNKEILENMNAKRFPTLITFIAVNDEGNMRLAEYTGDLNNFTEMFYFLDQVVLPALGKKREKALEDEDVAEEEIEEWTARSFNAHCIKRAGICVLAFLEGALSLESNAKNALILKRLKTDAIRKGQPYRFGWVDGMCEYELRDKFNIQETQLPNIGIYVPAKGRASNLVGVFSEEDIKVFLEKAYNGKVAAYSTDKPSFARRDCEEFWAQLQSSQAEEQGEDSDIVKAVLEEERKRREELGLEDSGKSKNKGRKKKGKKSKSDDL